MSWQDPPYTPEDLDLLHFLRGRLGLTHSAIAKLLGRPQSGISDKCYKLGIRPPNASLDTLAYNLATRALAREIAAAKSEAKGGSGYPPKAPPLGRGTPLQWGG